MMTSRTPVVLALALAGLGASSVSCTAILAPRDDVQRCGTADDCDATGDERYAPACRFDDPTLDADEFEKICVADFKTSVGCNPDNYVMISGSSDPHPYGEAFMDLADSARYVGCEESQLGLKGCPPPSGGSCNSGLTVNEQNLCDDGNPTAVAITTDTLGQDVRDQFCRGFFCDDRFVCDTGSNTCVLCDPEQPFGEGGCGEVFINGARSCVYESYSGPNDGACDAASESDNTLLNETVTFGSCM